MPEARLRRDQLREPREVPIAEQGEHRHHGDVGNGDGHGRPGRNGASRSPRRTTMIPAVPPSRMYVAELHAADDRRRRCSASIAVTISAAPASSSTASNRPTAAVGTTYGSTDRSPVALSASTATINRRAISSSAELRCQICGRKRHSQPSSRITVSAAKARPSPPRAAASGCGLSRPKTASFSRVSASIVSPPETMHLALADREAHRIDAVGGLLRARSVAVASKVELATTSGDRISPASARWSGAKREPTRETSEPRTSGSSVSRTSWRSVELEDTHHLAAQRRPLDLVEPGQRCARAVWSADGMAARSAGWRRLVGEHRGKCRVHRRDRRPRTRRAVAR